MSPDGVAPDESDDEVVAAPAPDTVAPAADALAAETAAYKKAEQEIMAETAGSKMKALHDAAALLREGGLQAQATELDATLHRMVKKTRRSRKKLAVSCAGGHWRGDMQMQKRELLWRRKTGAVAT